MLIKTDYTSKNGTSQVYHEGGKQSNHVGRFTRRIGNTNYRVGVHFSRTSRETIEDKVLRLLKHEGTK